MREIIRLVVVLCLICAISAGALTIARQSLGEKIEQQNDLYVRGPALERLFGRPASELLGNKVSFTSDGYTYPVFYTMEGGQVAGLAIEAPGTGGYGGDITVMVGIDLRAEKILGMEIIAHKETPGVGSQVEKPSFRRQWTGLSIAHPTQLGSQPGQIDGISGATYSSRAVVNGTNTIIDLVSKSREAIMTAIQEKGK